MKKRYVVIISLILALTMFIQISVSAEFVRIIKYTNGEKVNEYVGEASDYGDFDASFVDLSEKDFAMITDMDSDDVYYVYPSQEQEDSVSMQPLASANTQSGITVNTILYNSWGYIENYFDDSYIGVESRIQNNTSSAITVKPILAVYDEDGGLQAVRMEDVTEITANTVAIVRIKLTDYQLGAGEFLKAFLWDEEMTKPYADSFIVNNPNSEGYSDDYRLASYINDITKPINGEMTAGDGYDYLKFTAPESGSCTIACISTGEVTAGLYKDNLMKIQEDFYSTSVSLTVGNEYYLRIDGSGKYTVMLKYGSVGGSNFNIYDYDGEVYDYQKEIENICETLYNTDADSSIEMYDKLQRIIIDNTKLHKLPYSLEYTSLKNIDNFDDVLHSYYRMRYDEFMQIRQRYIDIIDSYERGDVSYTNPEEPSGGVAAPDTDELSIESRAAASLEILETYTDRVEIRVRFPSTSSQQAKNVYLLDFSEQNGEDIYVDQNIHYSGKETVRNLEPGHYYVLMMTHSRGCIYQRFYTEYDGEEEKTEYESEHVIAKLENDDKALAENNTFNTWLERMDTVYETLYDLTGYLPQGGDKMTINSTREDLSTDLSNGQNYWEILYGVSGSPINISRSHYARLMTRLEDGDWGDTPIHELSHNFDNSRWEFDAEALSLLKTYYVIEQLNATIFREDVATYKKSNGSYEQGWITGEEYYDFLSDTFYKGRAEGFDRGIYTSGSLATALIDIQKEIGWIPFKKTFRYFLQLSDDQIPQSNGEKLLLFLTKLKDFSGMQVISYIRDTDRYDDRAIIEDEFGIELDYIAAPMLRLKLNDRTVINNLPIKDEPNNSSEKDKTVTFEFEATETCIYYLYTAPYGDCGPINDTILNVYNLAGELLASNDDKESGLFSQISFAATEGITYYVEVGICTGNTLMTTVYAKSETPVTELEVDVGLNGNVASGDYMMYSFTPEKSGYYVYNAEKYDNDDTEYDNYLKLYNDSSFSEMIGAGHKKLINYLDAGRTYYLQHSGYFMCHAKAKIGVSPGATLEFEKHTGENFIFVNHPEFITNRDIVDDEISEHLKLFEQKNVTGKNHYYQIHTAWYGEQGYDSYFPAQDTFYLEVDFYNPTNETVSVSVEHLVYGRTHEVLPNNVGKSGSFDIEPGKHVRVCEAISGEQFLVNKAGWGENRASSPLITFDFEVENGSVTVSSLAAYNYNNLKLADNSENKFVNPIEDIKNGYIINSSQRPNEFDLLGKYKGIAENEADTIDVNLDLVIDESVGESSPLYVSLKDPFYEETGEMRSYWIAAINPLADRFGVTHALPESVHNFKYAGDNNRYWYFDYLHRNADCLNSNTGVNDSINEPISNEVIEAAKSYMASNTPTEQAPDPNALSIGEWGTTYHYTITVDNKMDETYIVNMQMQQSEGIIIGTKKEGENRIIEEYYGEAGELKYKENGQTYQVWKNRCTVEIEPKDMTTFEVTTKLVAGAGGTQYRIIAERKE